MAALARNVRFHLTSVRTRDGINSNLGFKLPSQRPVTGLAGLKIGGAPGDTFVPIVFDDQGHLYVESPVGSGKLIAVASTQVTPPAAASMQVAAAYTRGFLAFTDLKNSSGSPAVYDIASGHLDPLSMLPVGSPWQAKRAYNVGEIVTPLTPFGGNAHWYRCTVAGTSGNAQPVFPVTEGTTVADNTVTWQEETPLMAQNLPTPPAPVVTRNPAAGTFAASRDVYIAISYVNPQGETVIGASFVYVNTTLNDQFVVTGPLLASLAAWVQNLGGSYQPTGYNVYEADVATGAAAPAQSAYHKVNVGAVAFGVNTNVNTTGAGAVPIGGTAWIVPAGNICAGLRYAVILYVNRNGYISGMAAASVFSYQGATGGHQLYVPYIPVGPANTMGRLLAFTPAGTLSQLAGTGISNAGPYFWIPPAGFADADFNFSGVAAGVTVSDIVNGVSMNSTYINDNATTTATLNFTDDYLKLTTLDISAYFRKIQVPACSDIYYSAAVNRMFYAVDQFPSGWYVSNEGDPETVYGDTGIVQVSENNGENRVTVRDFNGVTYLFKERSGHILNPDVTDPSNWKATQQWSGSGPCGPRAVDVCTSFMLFVHRSGVYVYFGSGLPKRISKEIPITWAKINWKYAKAIWVLIDDETQEVRIGVPYGNSTVPNMQLRVNYEESPDFNPPIHFSPYIGKEIAAGTCYKWSVDDIPSNLAVRIERPLVNPPATLDYSTTQSQILHASSNPDGAVSAVVPFQYNDNGTGIDSVFETAAPQDLLRPNMLGGVQANIDGVGTFQLEVLALRAKDPRDGGAAPAGGPAQTGGSVIPLVKKCQAGIPYSCGARGQNERFRLRVSNGKQLNMGFDLKWAAIYARPISTARPEK